MNDQIFEGVVTTQAAPGAAVHTAPMGVRWRDAGRGVVLMPFKPSTTLNNILASGHAVLNLLTDTRVFAGCVTGRKTWPTLPAERVPGARLSAALRHLELRLLRQDDDPQRPVLHFEVMHDATHAPFQGLNRAQAAVIEGAVLVSRLFMLPAAEVQAAMAPLRTAVAKTAGEEEHEAWGWLEAAVQQALAAAPSAAGTQAA